MDRLADRCVLLRNLPPDCHEKFVSSVLKLAHGDFRFNKKYDKIHRHRERNDDITWIVCFKTREDALDCIRAGEWECSLEKGSCFVKPDYCSGCIIPQEWLETSQGSTTKVDDEQDRESIKSEDLFSSFEMIDEKIDKTGSYSNIGNKSNVVFRNRFDPVDIDSDMSDELFACAGMSTGVSTNFFSEGLVSSSEILADGGSKLRESNDILADTHDIGSTAKYAEHFRADEISTQFNASVRSADLFGFGTEYLSQQSENSEDTANIMQNEGELVTELDYFIVKENRSKEKIWRKQEVVECSKSFEIDQNEETERYEPSMPSKKEVSFTHLEKSRMKENIIQKEIKLVSGRGSLNMREIDRKIRDESDECLTSFADINKLHIPNEKELAHTVDASSNKSGDVLSENSDDRTNENKSSFRENTCLNAEKQVYSRRIKTNIGETKSERFINEVDKREAPTSDAHGFAGNISSSTQNICGISSQQEFSSHIQGHQSNAFPRNLQMVPQYYGIPHIVPPMYQAMYQGYPLMANAVNDQFTLDSEETPIFMVPVYMPHHMMVHEPSFQSNATSILQPEMTWVDTEGSAGPQGLPEEHEYWEINDYDMLPAPRALVSADSRPPLPLPRNSSSVSQKTSLTDLKNFCVDQKEKNNDTAEETEKNDCREENKHGILASEDGDDHAVNCRQIIVNNVPKDISEETLEMYFENKKKTGGGEILDLQIDRVKQQAIIEFKDAKDAEAVIKRVSDGLEFLLCGSILIVSEYSPPVMDPMKVLLKGISATTKQDLILNFIESGCGVVVRDVVMGETPGTVMLCFEKPFDFLKIRDYCCKRRCEGRYWQVSGVEQTRSVKVTGFGEKTSTDLLRLYFENKSRSCGGDVESVQFRGERNDCIVTFVHAVDAESTCKKTDHVIGKQNLTVSLHYPCLELNDDYMVEVPAPIVLDDMDDCIRKFLMGSSTIRLSIESGIASCYGRVNWSAIIDGAPYIQIDCVVDAKDRHGLQKVKDWAENCKQIFSDVCDTLFVEKSENIAIEIWTELKTGLMKITVPNPESVAVVLNESECIVAVVGRTDAVKTTFQQISSVILGIQETIKKENLIVTKKQRFKKYELLLVTASRIDQKFKKGLENISLDTESGDMVCKGKQKDVDETFAQIRAKLKTFPSRPIEGISKRCKELLFKKEARSYIKGLFLKEKIIGVWDVPKQSDIVMYSRNQKDVEKAIEILKAALKEENIKVNAKQAEALHSEQGKMMLRKLEDDHAGFVMFDLRPDGLSLACIDSKYNDIKSEISVFIDLNTIIQQFVQADEGTYTFIVQYKLRQIQNIEKQFSRLSVNILEVDEERKHGFLIIGKKDGCRLAIKQLQQIIDLVAHKILKVSWSGFDKYMKSKQGRDEIKSIELDEKCVVKVSFEARNLTNNVKESARPTTSSREQSLIKKSVIPGSLDTEKVDVIVNSTNIMIDLKVGRISRSLLKAGGDALEDERKNKYPDGIKVGEIAVTSGGALQCKELFHGVLDKWDQGQGHAERVMANFVQMCLEKADARGYKSIAFPALGTGQLGFPVKVVAKLMNEVVDDFGSANTSTSLTDVHFVVWHEDKELVKAFENYTVIRRRHSSTRERQRHSSDIERNFIIKGGNLQVSIGHVSVTFVEDDITKFVSGAIVNSTMDDLNLDSGAVSKAILKAAGRSIQQEASLQKSKFDTDGLVVTSPGFIPQCQKIIHVRARNSLQNWTNTIQKCLEVTESLGLNSVAFPALGTGGKGVPPQEMANTMMEAFKCYISSSDYKGTLKSITVVVYDRKTLDAFVDGVKASIAGKSPKRILTLRSWWNKPKVMSDAPPEAAIHIYGESAHVVESATRTIQKIRREKDLPISDRVLKILEERHFKDIEQIGNTFDEVNVVFNDDKITVVGFGTVADEAFKKVKGYIDNLEREIRRRSLTIYLPYTWGVMTIDDKTRAVALSTHDPEYQTVLTKFSSEAPGYEKRVIKIERIQNPTLYMQFIGKKREMEKTNKGHGPVAQLLWHGTRAKISADDIIEKGFDRNYNTGSLGIGNYFGVKAMTSLGYCSRDISGHHYIFLADVLTGEYCAATGATRFPPLRTGSLTYDSITDNVFSPGLFVIFHGTQAYPKYLITFI